MRMETKFKGNNSMKRILLGALAALLSLSAAAVPISQISPTGSTSGQAIVSSGPATAPAWSTITPAAIGGLKASNNLSDVASAATARTNLGLGTAAVATTGAVGHTLPFLDLTNTWSTTQTFSVPIVGGVSGITNGAAAAAGVVGQVISNAVPQTTVSLTTSNPANLASINLTAGHWLVFANATFGANTSSTVAAYAAGISQTSVTLPTFASGFLNQVSWSNIASTAESLIAPTTGINLSTATTIFLVGQTIFGSGTMTAGGSIWAIRIQ